jgi:hypothetical protein
MTNISHDLSERLLEVTPLHRTRTLAAVGVFLNGGDPELEIERCTQCDGIVRRRLPWNAAVQRIIEEWWAERKQQEQPSSQ